MLAGERLPRLLGLYRIRRAEREDVEYIRQTGLTLRQRQGMLSAVYAEEMPYRDPHTAGPALWAMRHATGCAFEVAVAPFTGTYAMRLGLEAVAIAAYWQAWGRSPTIQFGRMPLGYRMSTANNRRLVEAGKRFRGGVSVDVDASHAPSIAPMGPLSGDPAGMNWCGHQWSEWGPAAAIARLVARDARGLYRLRVPGQAGLVYVGQGRMVSRVTQHLGKVGNPKEPQGDVFCAEMQVSWTRNDVRPEHERLELENDLIAAYVLSVGAVPAAQFSAGGGRE